MLGMCDVSREVLEGSDDPGNVFRKILVTNQV